jgi:hypothetical protein
VTSLREGASSGDSVDIKKKPYPIEKYTHLLQALRDAKNPLIYNTPVPNPIPSPLEPSADDYYSYSASNSAPPKYALNKELHNTTEWTFHDNETEHDGLSQPPELIMSCES